MDVHLVAGDTSQAQTALMSTKSSNQSSELRAPEVQNQESGFPDAQDVGINLYVWKTMKITTTHNLSSTSNIPSIQDPILLLVEDTYIINRDAGPPPGVLAL